MSAASLAFTRKLTFFLFSEENENTVDTRMKYMQPKEITTTNLQTCESPDGDQNNEQNVEIEAIKCEGDVVTRK